MSRGKNCLNDVMRHEKRNMRKSKMNGVDPKWCHEEKIKWMEFSVNDVLRHEENEWNPP